jgi:hypothetical protein
MRVVRREFWAQCYASLGVAYLLVVSALHWSRGGPAVGDPRTESATGAMSALLAFYGVWYAIGFVALGVGWWRAAVRDQRA